MSGWLRIGKRQRDVTGHVGRYLSEPIAPTG